METPVPLESIDALSQLLTIPMEVLIPKSKFKEVDINILAESEVKYVRKK